jgi:hypothetical protein
VVVERYVRITERIFDNHYITVESGNQPVIEFGSFPRNAGELQMIIIGITNQEGDLKYG